MGLLRDLADGGRTVIAVIHSVQSLDLCDRYCSSPEAATPPTTARLVRPWSSFTSAAEHGATPRCSRRLMNEAISTGRRAFGTPRRTTPMLLGPSPRRR